MSRLSGPLKAQVRFWQELAGDQLVGKILIVKVLAVSALPVEVHVHQYSSKQLRGLACRLEAGIPDVLLDCLPERPEWFPAAGVDAFF